MQTFKSKVDSGRTRETVYLGVCRGQADGFVCYALSDSSSRFIRVTCNMVHAIDSEQDSIPMVVEFQLRAKGKGKDAEQGKDIYVPGHVKCNIYRRCIRVSCGLLPTQEET